MTIRNRSAITASFVAFAMILSVVSPANAVSEVDEEVRFFVESTSGFWKNALKVRHEFSNGFTTDSPGFQLGLAKVLGVKVYPVQRLNILPAEPAVDIIGDVVGEQGIDPAARGGTPGKPTPEPTSSPEPTPAPARPAPVEQVPWGVSLLTGGLGGGDGVTVAVLDTGVHVDHPDLVRRVIDCKDFTHRKFPIQEDKCDDGHGHGTHVAGTIAADGGEDGLGILGMAPEANLLAFKVCGKNGSCWSDDIAVAIRQAVDSGANIINLSLGSDTYSSLIGDAVAYAVEQGVLIVSAAGNDGPYPASIDYPAALTGVVAVGALDVDRVIAEWSSHGINTTTEPYVTEEGDIEFAAPGVNIESTFNDGAYAILSGTSMASPHIAGFAAAAWDVSEENPASAVRDLLNALSVDLEPAGDDDASGWGIPTL